MCTGMEWAAVAAMAGQSFSQIAGARSYAKAQQKANVAALRDRYTNSALQAEELNEAAEQQMTDRMREARKEMASLSALLGEAGASGPSGERLLYELAYGENVDLMRIRDNTQDELDALDRANRAGYKSVQSQNAAIRKNYRYQRLGAFLNMGAQAASMGQQSNTRKSLLNSQAEGGA